MKLNNGSRRKNSSKAKRESCGRKVSKNTERKVRKKLPITAKWVSAAISGKYKDMLISENY